MVSHGWTNLLHSIIPFRISNPFAWRPPNINDQGERITIRFWCATNDFRNTDDFLGFQGVTRYDNAHKSPLTDKWHFVRPNLQPSPTKANHRSWDNCVVQSHPTNASCCYTPQHHPIPSRLLILVRLELYMTFYFALTHKPNPPRGTVKLINGNCIDYII